VTHGHTGAPEVADTAPAKRAGRRTGPTVVIAALLIVGALWWAQALLIPIALGVFGSYALDPLERRLTGWGVPRIVAAVLILLALAAVLGGAAITLRQEANTFLTELPTLTQRVRRALEDGRSSGDTTVAQVTQAAEALNRVADASTTPPSRGVTRVQIEQPAIRLADVMWRGSLGAATLAGQATVTLFLLFYLLASGDLYRRKIVKFAGPSLSKRRITVEILTEITQQIERFLLMRMLISLIVGVSTGLAFAALGLEEPGLWGIAAGVLNTIPYFGATTVALAAGVGGFVQFGSVSMGLLVAGVAAAIAAVEGFILTPWLLGRASRMNAGAVFVCLTFWGWIWGGWGMLLAVPILISIKAVCDHIDAWRPFAALLEE